MAAENTDGSCSPLATCKAHTGILGNNRQDPTPIGDWFDLGCIFLFCKPQKADTPPFSAFFEWSGSLDITLLSYFLGLPFTFSLCC